MRSTNPLREERRIAWLSQVGQACTVLAKQSSIGKSPAASISTLGTKFHLFQLPPSRVNYLSPGTGAAARIEFRIRFRESSQPFTRLFLASIVDGSPFIYATKAAQRALHSDYHAQ